MPRLPTQPPRPLIVRLRNWVGDVVLSLPALHLLQSHGYQLHLTGKGWAPALLAGEGWPVHVRPAKLLDRTVQLRGLRREAVALDPGFARRPNALVFPNSFSGALEMRLAGLKATGYADEGRSPLLTRALPMPPLEGHMLLRFWHMACAFLGVEAAPPAAIALRTAPADQQAADALLRRHGIRPGFVVVCPTAGGNFENLNKMWPQFPAFTRALLAHGVQVLALPGPGEERFLAEQHPGVTALTGVGLGAYGGLLRRAGLVVANDTGPAHLAAAVGAPLLSVLGPTLPGQWAPWGPNVEIVRFWPEWPSVEQVLAPSLARLERRAEPVPA
jgi:heptosyltransferase II